MADAGDVWSVGIDFGTAFSKAAAMHAAYANGTVMRRMVPLHIGAAAHAPRSLIVASALFIDRGRIYFGPRAVEQLNRSNDEGREMLQSFKTVLGARDFEYALDILPTRAVDPEGAARRGDLIVLYLAYLLELVERAAPAELGELFTPNSKVRFRYSRPGWVPRRAAAAAAAMEKLMQAAAAVRRDLGDQLVSAEGVSYRDALDCVRNSVKSGETLLRIDGGIDEAGAVAACHLIDPSGPENIVIVDIGAGTTDFAGFVREGSRIVAIDGASHTINVAGDNFDRALMNLLTSKAKFLRNVRAQSGLWRTLLSDVRNFKEELVNNGTAEYVYQGNHLKCRLSEFLKYPDTISAARPIADVYMTTLKQVVAAIGSKKRRRVGVILAGGGAHLPTTIAMARKTRRLNGAKIEIVPTAPQWTSDLNSDKEFEALFAQMCVAFGAAI